MKKLYSLLKNFHQKYPAGFWGLVILTLLIFTGLFAEFISLVDPLAQDYTLKFTPPLWSQAGKWPHILGTDVLGRDVLSRLIYGARLSLFIGLFAVAVGAIFGIPIGLISGYYGGKIDSVVMRLIDLMLAFPSLLLAICIVAILGPSLVNAVIAIGLVSIPPFARLVRARVLGEREKDYVLADRAMGKSTFSIIFGSILQNIWGPLLVLITLGMGGAILDAAGLSFLGLGAQPPTPEWGALIAEGKNYVFQAYWLIFFPGLAIFVTVMAFNIFGDALRDYADPKTK